MRFRVFVSVLLLVLCAGFSSATVVNAVLGGVSAPVNVTSGDSFSVVVSVKYPCRTELRFYLDGGFYGMKHVFCRDYEVPYEFNNSDYRINNLRPGWHDIRVEAYDSKTDRRESFSDTRVMVVAKPAPSTTVAKAVSGTTSAAASTSTTTTTTLPATTTSTTMQEAVVNSTTRVNDTMAARTVSGSGTGVYMIVVVAGLVLVAAALLLKRVSAGKKGAGPV